MNNWQSLPSRGGLIGIGLTVVSAAACGLVLAVALSNALAPESAGANLGTFFLGLATFGLLLLTLFLAWRSWCFFRLRYYLDRNAVTIDLGGSRQIIPLGNVQQVATAESLLNYLKEEIASTKTDIRNSASRPNVSRPSNNEAVSTENSQDEVNQEAFARSQPRRQSQTTAKAAPKEGHSTQVSEAADSSFSEPLDFNSSVIETVEDANEINPTVIEGEVVSAEILEDQITHENEVEDAAGTVVEGELLHSEDVTEARTTEEAASVEAGPAPAEPVPASPALSVKMRGWRWPGYYFNKGYFPSLGEIQFYATSPFNQTVVIRTESATYAISPRDSQRFVTELKLRRNLGATEQLTEDIKPGLLLSHPLWHDRLGRTLIGVGVLFNLALFFFLLWRFNDLPQNVQIHFNKFGDPDRIGVTGDLMWLPFVGLVAVVANSFLGAWVQVRDKIPAYLLYAAGIVVQFLVVLALISILGGSNTGS